MNCLTGIAAMVALAGTPALVAAEDRVAPIPIVLVCVAKDGQLLSAEIFQSSNIPEIDAAALEVARASKFTPGKNTFGVTKRKSCLKFKVKFVLRDGELTPAGA